MPKLKNKDLNRLVQKGVVRVFFEVYKDLHFDLNEPTTLKKAVEDAVADVGGTQGLVGMPGLQLNSTDTVTAIMVDDHADRDAHLYFEDTDLDDLLYDF